MSRTSDFSKNHPYAKTRGWVGGSRAASALPTISDGINEVDNASEILVTGGVVSEPSDGVAQITIGGFSGSSNTSGTGTGSGGAPVYLRNNSPYDLIKGDVVVIDPTDDSSVTTTSIASNAANIPGVVQAPIARFAYGPVLMAGSGGLTSEINTAISVSRGSFAVTSTSPRLAGSVATRLAGAFAEYLTGTDLADFVSAVANTEESAATTSLTANMPAPIPAGRVLFMGLWLESISGTPSVSGWTRIGSTSGYWYFYKVSEGDDTAVVSWATASVAVATILLLHPSVSLASPIATQAFDSTTAAASLAGLSDVPRYALAGVNANVLAPGGGFTRIGGGAAGTTGTLTLVQSTTKSGPGATIALSSPATPGNLLIRVAENRDENALGPMPDPAPSGWTRVPLAGGAGNTIRAENSCDCGHGAIYYRTAQSGDQSFASVDNSAGEIIAEFSGVSTTPIDAAAAEANQQPGTSVSMASGTPGASALVVAVLATRLSSGGAFTASGSTNQIGTGSVPTTSVGHDDVVLLWATTTGSAFTFTGTLSGANVSYYWGMRTAAFATNRAAAGSLAGRYIGHSSSVTSPFSGASAQNDAVFAVNLQGDAKASALLYGPDLVSGAPNKGDLPAGGATLPAGANGTGLVADDSQASGLRWSNRVTGEILVSDTPAGSPIVFTDLLQNEGQTDLLYADI